MSVDKTIEELSQTLSQLSILVEHINGQIVGVTSRINITLDNFDNSVGGIARDASALTGQVGDTVSQIPNSWVFYLLFITLIVVLILLSILIVINLVTKAHAIYRLCVPDASESEANTPLPSNYSESRLLQRYDNSLQRFPKSTRNDISIPIEDARINTTSFPMDSSGINPSFHNNNGFQTGRPNLANKISQKKLTRVSVPIVPSFDADKNYYLFDKISNGKDYMAAMNQIFPKSSPIKKRKLPSFKNATLKQLSEFNALISTENNGKRQTIFPVFENQALDKNEDVDTEIEDKYPPYQTQHQPYPRRPPPAASTAASSNFSTQESPSNNRFAHTTYLVSKTEPV